MPKGGRLRPEEVEVLVEWVKAGAPWPASTTAGEDRAGAGERAYVITPEQRAFWSFQPIRKTPVPAVAHGEWPKTDIDRFVLARLEKRRPGTGQSRRQADADSPRHARSDRPAADQRGDRRVSEPIRRATPSPRSSIGCSRRRATARRGDACGSTSRGYGEDDYRSLDPMGRGYNPYPECLSVSRLGDQGLQRRHAARPVRARAAGRRSAGRRRAGADAAGARVPRPRPVVLRQRRGRDHRAPTSGTIASTSSPAVFSA